MANDDPDDPPSLLGENLLSYPGIFVTGTGTDVGKTIITAGLTGWLREAGADARAIKPAQTGAPADDDAGVVAAACDDPEASTCLRRFGPALAPRVAAEREGAELSYSDILAATRGAIEETAFPVVEGIGGLRVPLADDAEVIDLAEDLGLPAVVVARPGLGTLNHTALTVDALESRDVPVILVVLNRYGGATVAERTNPEELERISDVPVETVPQFDASDPSRVIPVVRSALSSSLSVDVSLAE